MYIIFVVYVYTYIFVCYIYIYIVYIHVFILLFFFSCGCSFVGTVYFVGLSCVLVGFYGCLAFLMFYGLVQLCGF